MLEDEIKDKEAEFTRQTGDSRKQIHDRETEISKSEKDLKNKKQEVDEQKRKFEAKEEAHEKELKKREDENNNILFQSVLNRASYTNKNWHKKNIEAVTHLFGFRLWKETVLIVHALFGLYPLKNPPLKKKIITPSEWCLMAKIRM